MTVESMCEPISLILFAIDQLIFSKYNPADTKIVSLSFAESTPFCIVAKGFCSDPSPVLSEPSIDIYHVDLDSSSNHILRTRVESTTYGFGLFS